MKKHLALWLAVIFAAFHLIVVGGAILEAGGGSGGEGLAFVVYYYDSAQAGFSSRCSTMHSNMLKNLDAELRREILSLAVRPAGT